MIRPAILLLAFAAPLAACHSPGEQAAQNVEAQSRLDAIRAELGITPAPAAAPAVEAPAVAEAPAAPAQEPSPGT